MVRFPDWWQALVLALAVFRLVRLVGRDTITAQLRGRLTLSDYTYERWHPFVTSRAEQDVDAWGGHDRFPPPFTKRRWKAAELARCPWCAGWWIAGLVWAAWSLAPRATLWLAVWPALSGTVGLVARHLDAEKENE